MYRHLFCPIRNLSKLNGIIMKRTESTEAKPYLIAMNAIDTPELGKVYAKRPFKYTCQAGRAYIWCTCGWSRNQPFCDATHTNMKFKIKNKPIRFECKETKEYWFCQCKQTKNRPFCDGSHKSEQVQNAKSTIDWLY